MKLIDADDLLKYVENSKNNKHHKDVITQSCHMHEHNHHHHHSTGFAVGAGILGAGLVASAIYDATHPRPVIVESAPVVVTPAVQPVVVTPAPVVTTGHYETHVQNVWVEGRYIDQATPQGTIVRVWQPGHYEQQSTQVWVSP